MIRNKTGKKFDQDKEFYIISGVKKINKVTHIKNKYAQNDLLD